MRILHPKLHAVLDYFIALLSILSPVLFNFGTGQRETLASLCFGLLIILYSFFTDYLLGLAKQISLDLHLRMDQFLGALMMASPWLFNFDEAIYLPHILLGLSLFVSAMLTGNDIILLVQSIKQRPWEKWFRMPSEQ
ncbi:MAG TPA: hypothetical protein VD993_06415 [Chitinophagaceae bacterium]|nr:hypothetical protein [Chitinophagaceae bacterium]